ncbi:MAG: response regulator, partial [Euryarchaeota archaeon]|nr:response regulator [Euryarchaeota archaeon]
KIYDLILMDIALPEMNGIEARRLIKSKPEYKEIPVIALTAFAMGGDKERFLSEGFDDYISKPLDISNFIKKVERYCS